MVVVATHADGVRNLILTATAVHSSGMRRPFSEIMLVNTSNLGLAGPFRQQDPLARWWYACQGLFYLKVRGREGT